MENDGVYISDDGGNNYTKIHEFSNSESWYNEILDLESLANLHNIAPGPEVKIKF